MTGNVMTSGVGVSVMGASIWIWEGSPDTFKYSNWWPGNLDLLRRLYICFIKMQLKHHTSFIFNLLSLLVKSRSYFKLYLIIC